MAKSFHEYDWIVEALSEEPSFFTKRMFGGVAVYYGGLMVMHFAADDRETCFRGKDYGFKIWNGLLFPTDREHHESLIKDFPSLENHVVLPKWLYLRKDREDFESSAEEIIERIAGFDPRFGIVPKSRKKKTAKKAAKKTTKKKISKKKAIKKSTKKTAKKASKKVGKKASKKKVVKKKTKKKTRNKRS